MNAPNKSGGDSGFAAATGHSAAKETLKYFDSVMSKKQAILEGTYADFASPQGREETQIALAKMRYRMAKEGR